MENSSVSEQTVIKQQNIVQTLLGDDYGNLPKIVQNFHEHPELEWFGDAMVKGSNHLIFRVIRYFIGLPSPSGKMLINVKVQIKQTESVWTRSFGKFCFKSALGCQLEKKLMCERIGPLKFYFKLRVSDQVLHWDLEYATLFNLPLPRCLNPVIIAEESAASDLYHFKAYTKLPLLGVLLDYEGNLRAEM